MASFHNPRLNRRLATLTAAARNRVRHRQHMREYARASTSIRAALSAAGIDLRGNDGLRHFGYAESVVSEWPDTPELQRADSDFIAQDAELASRETLDASAALRASCFADRPPPKTGRASPLDWYAWSLAARSAQGSKPP